MKTNLIKTSLITCAVVALALSGSVNIKVSAADPAKGAQMLMKPIKTAQDIESIEPGDTIAMACPKCKTISYTHVEKTTKGANPEAKVDAKHLCPGCETTLKSQGTGKHASDVITHVCKTCGSEDAFCCIMKKGSEPTTGMHKKKHK